MKKVVQEYLRAKQHLVQYFGIEGDYFFKPLANDCWRVKQTEDVYFLSYWRENGPVSECVVVKKNNKPLIVTRRDYTLVVGIECVKIGFVFKNANRMD